MVNFLFDPQETPHIKVNELYEQFGVSQSTGGNRSRQVRDLMKMAEFDPIWTLPSKMYDNPLAWFVLVDGLALDMRQAPREIQEEAFRRGLIPFIPGKQEDSAGGKVVQIEEKKREKKAERDSGKELLRQAQELVHDAIETDNKRQRIALARKALEISEDCAHAYLILAEDAANDWQEAKVLYEKGVKAGENAIGPHFQEYKGHFWGILETRPYMRARWGLASTLWVLGEKKPAIEHLKDMLLLNPGDNQGLRYTLINWLLEQGEGKEAEKLHKKYKDDYSACWYYSHALLLFRKGSVNQARSRLKEAIKFNPYVSAYLLGKKKLPKALPDTYSPGQEDEAVLYADDSIRAWQFTKGAYEWLRENAT